MLEVNTGMLPGSSSIPPPKRNKTADLTKRNVINSSIKPPKGSAVCQEEGNVSRYSRDVVQVTKLTSSMILLNHVPVDVSASDVMNSIFAGLSISCIYVCTRESKLQQLYAANTSDIHTHAVVDLYVDFTSISGAELALLRTGEELQYKVNLQSIAGSNASQPSSSSKAGAPNVVRKRCAPHLQEVDQELSFWVKFIGLKLTSSSKVSSGSNLLSMNSTIRKHMEVLRGVLSEIDCAGVVNKHVSGENYTSTGKINSYSFGTLANICNTAHVLLCDPTILRNYWHPVVSQLLLAPGTREAYDRDQERKVRISKDTKYLLSHPAVDDILLFSSQSEDDHFCGEGEISFAPDDLNAGKGFIDDLGEGVYRADQDAQLLQFESFVQEAEDAVQCYTKLWSELVFRTEMEQASSGKLPVEKGKGTVASMVAEGTAFTYIGSTAYGVENFHRKLVLCKLLFKESWGLCTTHCVFDK